MMNRRLFVQVGALGTLTAMTLALPALAQATRRQAMVIQMSDNDPAKWNLALNNARNLQEDVGAANVDIEIVAYGPGINMFKLESPMGARVADALRAQVKIVICENTMRGQKVTKDDMLPDLAYVPAGVTEIMKKQQEGWAYLRP